MAEIQFNQGYENLTDNQKREFRNVGEFYGFGKTLSQLISLSEANLTSIADGEPIE